MRALTRDGRCAGRALLIGLLAAAAACVPAASADAYFNSVRCNNYYSAQTCWIGDGYHSWVEMRTILDWGPKGNVCAKGRTAAGNTRTGSGNGCDTNTANRISCFGYHEPLSAGYGYWAGTGSPVGVVVAGQTPSDRQFC